jgi:flagellar P-ring protein FlgI
MFRKWLCFCLVCCGSGLFPISTAAASRIKDVAAFEEVRGNQLYGYGLVVGLNGTGDRSQAFFPTQTLANMLLRSGITIDPDKVRIKNIAAVMVTAELPPFIRQGSRIDVTVSSLGDAQSIQGGVLIMTPLQAANGRVYVNAQGQIALGGYSAGGNNNRAQLNHPTVGRIPSGGLVEQDVAVNLAGKSQLNLVLYRSDFTTATRAARAINALSEDSVANAIDGRTISIKVPSGYNNRIVEFMSVVENATMDLDNVARVVLNEKTGTVVFGKDVRITEVSIIHGSLSLQVGTVYNISQPEALSQGKTTVVPEKNVSVQEEKGRTVTLREGASVEDVVRALNAIGAGPRDVISILQAIKAQGALQAELEII